MSVKVDAAPTKTTGSRSGAEFVESIRDGRAVYIEGERVKDVTTHPAFRNSVRSIARLYDIAREPANQEAMTYVSPKTGRRVSRFWMIPRSREDLATRRKASQRWAEETCGLMGRAPDVGSFLPGMASAPDVFGRGGTKFAENLTRFYEKARDNDVYLTYVVVPPQIDRSKPAHMQEEPDLHAGVVKERDDGIVIRGAQMLGTGTAISDYVLLSCIHPMRPGEENYANSMVIPISSPGLKVISRRSYARAATSLYDYPLSRRFDETDSFVVFDNVFVPWENVFVYRNIELARAQWFETPAHVLGNHQSHVRYATKMRFVMGLAKRIVQMNGTESQPAVQGMLGEMGAYAVMHESLIVAQEAACTIDRNGVAVPGKRQHYANQVFQTLHHSKVMDMFRELVGGGVLQLPSSFEDFENAEISNDINRYIRSPGSTSQQRVALMKLAWDMIGSEFAGRHQQYEKFYAGAPFIVRTHVYREYDFKSATDLVDGALDPSKYDGYDLGRI